MILNLFIAMVLSSLSGPQVIYDFSKVSDVNEWRVVDDVVMGGRSSGSMYLSDEGHGVFKGEVSLENNGGFSSVRYNFPAISTQGYSKVQIKLKGDGKDYQFRVKANDADAHSYVKTFSTSGKWQTVEIPLNEMYPSFRGRKLDMSNFDKDQIEEIGILIGNKKEQSFTLLLENIELR